ncbi:MAG TPA: peptide ABC transporter permease [Burkholderiales bacterium]|nr:peptide ABC transporter permease [Burkholderiales bacterium]
MKTLFFLSFLILYQVCNAACSDLVPWARSICERFSKTLCDGHTDLYLSGYAQHVDFHDPLGENYPENQYAWGLGIGRGRMNDSGNEDMLLVMGIENSHRNAQFSMGYAWQAYWQPIDKAQWFKFGLGYTVAILQRPDIANGIPFPVILDLASLKFGNFTLYGMYIPIPKINTGMGYGNVFYFFAKYSF